MTKYKEAECPGALVLISAELCVFCLLHSKMAKLQQSMEELQEQRTRELASLKVQVYQSTVRQSQLKKTEKRLAELQSQMDGMRSQIRVQDKVVHELTGQCHDSGRKARDAERALCSHTVEEVTRTLLELSFATSNCVQTAVCSLSPDHSSAANKMMNPAVDANMGAGHLEYHCQQLTQSLQLAKGISSIPTSQSVPTDNGLHLVATAENLKVSTVA